MDEPTIIRTVHIQADRARVWAAITEPSLIGQWFADGCELELVPGGAGALSWDDDGRFELVVEEVDPGRVFAFRWCPEPTTIPAAGTSTVVRFTLDDEDGGIRLTVVETGWDTLEPRFDAMALRDGNIAGWEGQLDELRAVLERQDSQ